MQFKMRSLDCVRRVRERKKGKRKEELGGGGGKTVMERWKVNITEALASYRVR